MLKWTASFDFADHTHKCTTSTSYVAMATQAIRLIEELKGVHSDKGTLDYKMVAISTQSGKDPIHLSAPLDIYDWDNQHLNSHLPRGPCRCLHKSL